jgi:hypothetical protein
LVRYTPSGSPKAESRAGRAGSARLLDIVAILPRDAGELMEDW